MKKLFLICLMLLISVSNVFAAKLSWIASDSQVDGYIIYCSYNEWASNFSLPIPNVTEFDLDAVVSELNLQVGLTYKFRLTAYNVAGESEPSNEVEWLVPGAYIPPPKKVNTVTTITIPTGTTVNIIETE